MPEQLSAHDKALILTGVMSKHGKLTAELVVQEANPRNKSGVAHQLADLVGWSVEDKAAAHRWRTDQARVVIRSAEPELIKLGVLEIAAPYFVRDPAASPGEQGYVSLASIKTREDWMADTMRTELDRAVSCLQRAHGIAVSLGMEEEAGEVVAALGALGRLPGAQMVSAAMGEEVPAD